MKLFGIIFLSVGLLMFLIGVGWFRYEYSHIMEGVMDAIIGPGVFLILGFVFGAIGGGVLYNEYRLRRRRETLMRTGRRIQAKVVEIGMNRSISVNGRHPYIVTCQANVSGRETTFRSANIFGSLLLNVGDELTVYLDFQNPDKYWVEVPESFIQK